MTETLSICFAVFGRCSEIWTAFAAVAIALKGPPNSVPGFGSQVSIWLCAPCIQKRMQDLAFAVFSCASAGKRPNFPARPAAAEPPRAIRTKSRREQLGQWLIDHPTKTNSEELNSIQKTSAYPSI